MSSSKADTQVLVSGVTGFIASQIALTFLEAGYSVRGTLRSQAKADEYKAKHPTWGERLSFAIVPDVAVPGAFKDAIKGVDIFLHAASPLASATTEDNEKNTLLPAINGTLEALRAASTEPRVKKVIITSSIASAMAYGPSGVIPKVYTEADWNHTTFEQGKATTIPIFAYATSKALAEKAAWAYVEEHKPTFTVVTILPSIVYGASTQAGTLWPIAGTNRYLATTLLTKQDPATFPLLPIVDVRDIAKAQLLAAENPSADGQRFIVSQKPYHHSQAVPYLKKLYPERASSLPDIPDDYVIPPIPDLDGSKAEKVLGLKYTPVEETIKYTADWILSLLPEGQNTL